MKAVRFLYQDKIECGFIDTEKEEVYFAFKNEGIAMETINDLITHYVDISKLDFNQFSTCTLKEIELLEPVMPTKNIICIGKNYAEHIKELDGDDEGIRRIKENPVFFSKALTSLNGPYAEIPSHDQITDSLDYEVELAVVIGKEGVNISEEDALEYVFGYTILNDVTGRDLQKKHQQWFKGKSLDGCCPMGPWIVTKEEIKDPNNLNLKSYVNNEVRQDSNTNDMIYSVKQLIHIISTGMTLKPGDVIATGTPSGVGMGFNPPKTLKVGDVVRCEVEAIGFIENKIRQ
jgi:2-keto-4-pentenoate hydratase/2-oxohepta-3-ene-1,7-dioic acid hydratase in catechol pathway